MSDLLRPIPQYVLGCLPAIATVGASPMEGFLSKLMWMMRCLGCPFSGLYYNTVTKNDRTSLCIFWLSVEHFEIIIESSDDNGVKILHRPIGIYNMRLAQENFTKKTK